MTDTPKRNRGLDFDGCRGESADCLRHAVAMLGSDFLVIRADRFADRISVVQSDKTDALNSLHFTADQARSVAAELLASADAVDAARGGVA